MIILTPICDPSIGFHDILTRKDVQLEIGGSQIPNINKDHKKLVPANLFFKNLVLGVKINFPLCY